LSNLNTPVKLCLLLFLFVFGLWQIMYVLIDAHLLPEWLQPSMYLEVYILSIGAAALLIVNGGSGFQDYGFWWPEDSLKPLFVSMFLALIYILITLFLPGSIKLFKAMPPITYSQAFVVIVNALFLSLASESVFRGYIQTNLTKAYGFPLAVCFSSVMFSLHNLPLLLLSKLDPTYIFTSMVSLFMTGIFLGFFFERTETLSYPVIFYTFALVLHYLTTLEVATNGYLALLFEIIAYSLLIPIVRFWKTVPARKS